MPLSRRKYKQAAFFFQEFAGFSTAEPNEHHP
jgi:hypothetical protein